MNHRNLPYAGVMLLIASLMGGCQLVAWVVAVFQPPQKVNAVYEPPQGKRYLVFVDDRQPVPYEPIKFELADLVSKGLVEHGIARSTVPYELVQDLSMTPGFQSMPISEVGRRLGAEVVLYVQIDKLIMKDNPMSPLWQGRFETSVWVVDAEASPIDARLWPKDRPRGIGHPVPPVELKPQENPSATYGQEVASKLAQGMSTNILRLFHKHEVSPDEGREKELEYIAD
ncbi:MAG: hypothetical protein GXY38_01085 [Planctomycetes bacterium]|jgi:hypothetical protein|nr:hypothetical protein [Planctomycetota bacterium]